MSITLKNYDNRHYNEIFSIFFVIISMLTMLSIVLLSVRLTSFLNADKREINILADGDFKFELFSVEYESESGEVIVTGSNGDKVIAPGVSENYELRLRNTDGSAINFELTPVVSYTSEYSIPLYFKMYDEDGKYLIGSENKWVSVEEMKPISDFKTLARAKSEEYVLQWKWDYESGNDALDTELGINAGSEDIGVKVELRVITEANTDIEANKEIIYMGIVSGALILVFVVTAIVFIKKKRAGTI